MTNAIIVGAGTYGQVYSEYLKESHIYNVIGFIDDDPKKQNTIINFIPVIGDLLSLNNIMDKKSTAVFVPIGDNIVRSKIIRYVRSLGFITPSFIHKSVQIHSTVKIKGTVYILPNVSIMPFSSIDDLVMISMGVNIAHHTSIGTGCFFSQGTNIGASIIINNYSFVGIGATVMTGVKLIGENALIGAGSVVIKDVPDNAIIVGVPGKIIKFSK